MLVVAYILLATSIACSSGTSSRSGAAATTAVGNDDTAGAMQGQPQGSLPADHEKITFSTYAEVTAADVVEIVLLVDSELAAEQQEKLAKGVDALLKHIINSNWHLAVADLAATAYPTKFITKYANYADYGQQFAAALGADQETGSAPDTAAPAPDTGQLNELSRRDASAQAVRVFIIVTAKSLPRRSWLTTKWLLLTKKMHH